MQVKNQLIKHRVAVMLLGVLLLHTITGYAQENNYHIQGNINLDARYILHLQKLVHGVGNDDNDPIEIPLNNKGQFHFDAQVDKPTWYRLTFMPAKRDQQLGASFPFLFLPNTKEDLQLHYTDSTYLTIADKSGTPINHALIDYAAFSNQKMRSGFLSPPTASAYRDFAQDYIDQAESLVQQHHIQEKTVKDYLKTWSYINYATAIFQRQQELTTSDFPTDLLSRLDNTYTLSFYNGSTLVDSYLQLLTENTSGLSALDILEHRFETAKSNLKTSDLLDDVLRIYGTSFVRNYKIKDEHTFDQDNIRFGQILTTMNDRRLAASLAKDLNNLRYTQQGSIAPDVIFHDTKGNAVRLQDFKGKYIYIDLWASWCVPCIQEIPYLQKLEYSFEGRNIVFISISLDADKADWLRKVKDLNLEGRQWHQAASGYDKLMNVQGIPHFILYGPDGRLIQYKAPRPSSDAIQNMLEDLL